MLRTGKNTSAGRVFVGLSGGVDSAVSAALLKGQGYEVTGVFITIQIPGYPCPAAEDRRDAMRVAAHLELPFLEIDLSKEYERDVLLPSLQEYKKGRTPNPDTLCNEKIKFGPFFDFCRAQGAGWVATGHYARTSPAVPRSLGRSGPLGQVLPSFRGVRQESVILLAGTDLDKDQSYFLWQVPEAALRHTLFPVGDKTKKEVRALACRYGLPNAERPDSQGLCFLGDISLGDVLAGELSPEPGEVLDEEGRVVGRHRGAVLYTLGERHGFELFSQQPDTPPHFVVGKDIVRNTITISPARFPRGASKTLVTLSHTNWIGDVGAGDAQARFRYRQKLIPAALSFTEDGAQALLQEPHYVPLGQSLVLYREERCLGGGAIESVTLVQ